MIEIILLITLVRKSQVLTLTGELRLGRLSGKRHHVNASYNYGMTSLEQVQFFRKIESINFESFSVCMHLFIASRVRAVLNLDVSLRSCLLLLT